MTAGAPSRSYHSRSVGARLVAVPDRLAELAHGAIRLAPEPVVDQLRRVKQAHE